MKNQYNSEGQKHGYWEECHFNGGLWYKGTYVNGLIHGYSENYYDNGKLKDKGSYHNGEKYGYWESYYYNGEFCLRMFYIKK